MTFWHLAIRFLFCCAITMGMWRWGENSMGILTNPQNMLGWIFLISVIWILAFGSALTHWLGEKFGNLLSSSGAGFELKPQYSIAEARVREGNYREAIEAFRMYAAQYPNEVYPHSRIAELYLQSKDFQAAIEELEAAVKKAKSPDSFSMIHFRLADLHLEHGNNVQAALTSLREIQRRHPRSRHAQAALERAKKLLKKQEIA